MKRILMLTAAAAFAATAAAAAITAEGVVDTFKAGGYGSIEVKVGPTQIKAEAVRDGVKVEVVYDKETGAILKQETGAAAGAATNGVEISLEERDFVRGSRTGDDSVDDSNDDSSGRSGSGGDDSSGKGGSGGGNSGSGNSGSGNSGSGNSGSGG